MSDVALRRRTPVQRARGCFEEERAALVNTLDPGVPVARAPVTEMTDDHVAVSSASEDQRGRQDRQVVAVSAAAPECERRRAPPVALFRIRDVTEGAARKGLLHPARHPGRESPLEHPSARRPPE